MLWLLRGRQEALALGNASSLDSRPCQSPWLQDRGRLPCRAFHREKNCRRRDRRRRWEFCASLTEKPPIASSMREQRQRLHGQSCPSYLLLPEPPWPKDLRRSQREIAFGQPI